MDRPPTERNDTAKKNYIGWDTCIDTGHTPMKRAANKCLIHGTLFLIFIALFPDILK